MPWFNNRKHEIFKLCFTVHTKASDISLYRKKCINLQKDTKEYLQSSLKQISIIPFNKVPHQQSALIRKIKPRQKVGQNNDAWLGVL